VVQVRNRVAVSTREVEYPMYVRKVLAVGPAFEQIAKVDNKGAFRRRHVDPGLRRRVPDFETGVAVLQEESDKAEVFVLAVALLADVVHPGWLRVMVHLEVGDGPFSEVLDELIGLFDIAVYRHGDSSQHFNTEEVELLKVVHADILEVLSQAFGPVVRSVGELPSHYLRVVPR